MTYSDAKYKIESRHHCHVTSTNFQNNDFFKDQHVSHHHQKIAR